MATCTYTYKNIKIKKVSKITGSAVITFDMQQILYYQTEIYFIYNYMYLHIQKY